MELHRHKQETPSSTAAGWQVDEEYVNSTGIKKKFGNKEPIWKIEALC
ncbi:MAG: hypothetical protein ACOX7X_05570 [Methanosarcina flavescens]|jgi:hypothetical protein|uniref:Uncharacterized protein n=1 Tax=Methanosarcina flavescens TaxID=1715806 RepID=A0A7K4AWH7_9EURY|nr:hypothetical protein [Methanosarcina flavescens]NLK33012.1 hypothetical protein [Methanosarcina flavescens]